MALSQGVKELETSKRNPLLRLKYHDSITDAVADLGGKPDEIKTAFAGYQKYLYAWKGLEDNGPRPAGETRGFHAEGCHVERLSNSTSHSLSGGNWLPD